MVVVVTLLLVLAGTTFAGHDWNSGSMSNQLLFEPRRARVWVAKGGVVLGGRVHRLPWSCSPALLARPLRRRPVPRPPGRQRPARRLPAARAARAPSSRPVAALGGFALTMLFRSTVATLGVLFAVAIAGGLLIAALGISERW